MNEILLQFAITMRDDGAHVFNDETLKLYVANYLNDAASKKGLKEDKDMVNHIKIPLGEDAAYKHVGKSHVDPDIVYNWGVPCTLFNVMDGGFYVHISKKMCQVDKNNITAIRMAYQFVENNPDYVLVDQFGFGVEHPDEPRAKYYMLIKKYETPTEIIYPGVVKQGYSWLAKFKDMHGKDFAIKTDWFKEVNKPI